MLVREPARYVETAKGDGVSPDEGVLLGDPNARVRRLLLTWMAAVAALDGATP
jgi:hypothetical protein